VRMSRVRSAARGMCVCVCASEHGDNGTRPSAVSATQPHDVSGHNGDGTCERRESAGQRPKANDVCGVLSARAAVSAAAAFGRAPSHARRDAAWSVREQREGAAVVEIRPETEISRPEGLAQNSRELAAPARSTNAIRQMRC
jgi:hypothetical protein